MKKPKKKYKSDYLWIYANLMIAAATNINYILYEGLVLPFYLFMNLFPHFSFFFKKKKSVHSYISEGKTTSNNKIVQLKT